MTFDYDQCDHSHLIEVVPVGVTRPAGDLSVTLLSIERYQAGFNVVLMFEQSVEPAVDPTNMPLIFGSMPAVTGADDRGGQYESRSRSGAGGGGGSSGLARMRGVHTFAPALEPLASTLILEIRLVKQLGWDRDGNPRWGAADVVAGPWSASFPLPARPETR